MKYESLIETVSAIIENEQINKKGLVLTYYLDEFAHNNINAELFYRANAVTNEYVPSDEFEVEIGGILVKFIKNIVS